MGHALKDINTGEGSRGPAVSSPVVAELLEACKAMLPLVRGYCAGVEGVDAVVGNAERAIERAESDSLRHWGAMPPKSGFFGRVGNHYDFEITVKRTHERTRHYRIEGRDRLGRRVIIRVVKDEEGLSVTAGEVIFFRGRILAHRALFGAPVNYIEATSGVVKLE